MENILPKNKALQSYNNRLPLPSNEAYYVPTTLENIHPVSGAWASKDEAEEVIKRELGDIPIGLTIAVDNSTKDSDGNDIPGVEEWWWFGPKLGFTLKGGSSGGGLPGTGITVQSAYIANVDNDNILVPADSTRRCTLKALIEATRTKVRLTYLTLNIEASEILLTSFLDNDLLIEQGALTIEFKFGEVQTEGEGDDEVTYVEYYYLFKVDTEDTNYDPEKDTTLYVLPSDKNIGFSLKYLTYTYTYIQPFRVNEGDYTYRIYCRPDVFSLPRLGNLPQVSVDMDIFDSRNRAIIEDDNYIPNYTWSVKYINKAGEEIGTLASGSKDTGTSALIGGDDASITLKESQVTKNLKTYINENLDSFLFGEYILIEVTDGNVTQTKYLSILREDSLVGVITSDYDINISNPIIKITKSLLGKTGNKLVKVNSTVVPEIVHNGESLSTGTFSEVKVLFESSEDYDLVLVDSDDIEYHCTNLTELDAATTDHSIVKTYFNKIGDDCSIEYTVKACVDEKEISARRIAVVLISNSINGYWMTATPDSIAYVNTNISVTNTNYEPSSDTVNFSVYAYSGDDNVELVENLSSKNLSIEKIGEVGNIGLSDTVPETIDTTPVVVIYNLYENLGEDKKILWDSCTVRLYKNPEEYKVRINASPSSTIKNGSGTVTLTATLINAVGEEMNVPSTTTYIWSKAGDSTWSASGQEITITDLNVNKSADFYCEISF